MTRGTKVPYGGKQTVGKGSAEDPFSSQSRKKRIDQVLTKYGVRGAGTSAGWQRGTGTKLEKPSPAKLQHKSTGLPTVSSTPAATQTPTQETGWKRAGKTSSSAVAECQPEQIEADRQTAGQLGGKLRLGEATDRDVEDYLKRIQTDYGYTPATASQEEKLDQVQSYLRSQQPKAATYAELQAEGRDPLSRLANTVSGAAKQFGGSMAQTASTMAEQISPSMVLHLLNSPTAENPFLDRAADALLEPAKEWLVEGTQSTADRLSESGAKDIMKAQEGLNPAGRMLVNAGAGAAQMAGDAAIGAVTGGGSMLSLLARSFGGGVQEARGKGYSEEEQLALGLASAATEYFSERLFGGNPVYDTDVGLVNWLVGKVVKNPTVMKVLASAPVETVNEGLEEMVSGLLNPALEWAITGNRPEYELDELIEEGATGILAALLARGGAAVVNKTVKSSLVNDATADDLLRDRKALDFLSRKGGLELKSSMTQAEKRQAVREAVERIARKKPGNEEVGFETEKKDGIIPIEKKPDAAMQDKVLAPLTEEETAAILAYKSSESYKINAKLRDGFPLTAEEQTMVTDLDRALEKLPKAEGTVYRTLCFDDLSDAEGALIAFLAEHEIKNVVRYPAYTSTSTKLDGHPLANNTKYGVVLEISGESIRLLEGLGNNFECEALFLRKTVFYITGVEQDTNGIYHIRMEEVAENAGEREK